MCGRGGEQARLKADGQHTRKAKLEETGRARAGLLDARKCDELCRKGGSDTCSSRGVRFDHRGPVASPSCLLRAKIV